MKVKNKLILFLVLSLTGCSAKVVSIYNSDVSNVSYKTFTLQNVRKPNSVSSDNKKLDSLLSKIIIKNLLEKGFKQSSIPDLYASYLINVHSSFETQNNNYNPYSASSYFDPYSYNYNTRTYKEGVLIIELKNDEGRLVWQGSKTFKLNSKSSIRETLSDICLEIIETYQINPGS